MTPPIFESPLLEVSSTCGPAPEHAPMALVAVRALSRGAFAWEARCIDEATVRGLRDRLTKWLDAVEAKRALQPPGGPAGETKP